MDLDGLVGDKLDNFFGGIDAGREYEEDTDSEEDEEVEEDSENNSEEAPQDDESSDNEEVVEEVVEPAKPSLEPDLLGQAIARLNASDAALAKAKAELVEANVQLSRPRYVPYSALPPDAQAAFDAGADAYGISVEQLVFNEYNKLVAQWENNARHVMAAKDAAVNHAKAEINAFFDAHPLSKTHGADVIKVLHEQGWDKVDAILQRDPDAYRLAASTVINAAFKDVDAQRKAAARTTKSKEAMKASTRGEASRTVATVTKSSQPDENDEFKADILKHFRQNKSWTQRLQASAKA